MAGLRSLRCQKYLLGIPYTTFARNEKQITEAVTRYVHLIKKASSARWLVRTAKQSYRT
jgi:hypothetical protein